MTQANNDRTVPDLVTIANGKLDDPVMLEWALRYYDNLAKNARETRAALESTWFHDLFIAQLIECEETGLLTNLFRSLPAKRFSNLAALMVQRWPGWPGWPGNVADAAARILAENTPEILLNLFEAHLQRIEQGSSHDTEKFRYVETLAQFGADARIRAFCNRLCPRILSLPDHAIGKAGLLSALLRLTGVLSDEASGAVLDAALQIETRGHARENLLKQLFRGLYGHAEYLDLVIARGKKESQQRFEALAPFFSPGAPLAMLDGWVDSPPALADMLPALAAAGCNSKGCAALQRLLESSRSFRDSLPESTQAQIVQAACVHGHALASFDAATLDLETTAELLAADLDTPRWFRPLFERLRSFPRADIVAALTHRLPAVSQTYGAIQLAKAMGELGWEEFVPCLIGAMGKDQGDFLHEAAQQALVEIGHSAQAALIERWGELDISQRIFGLSVIKNVGGTAAADFALARFDELMADCAEFCCELLLAAPDPRLLDRLRPEVRRRQPLIDRAYYIIARLLDRDEPEVQAARDRALADFRRSVDIWKALDAGDLVRDSLHLQLRCPACGDVNGYEVKGVILPSKKHKDIPYLVNDEFPCASCGQDVEFEFTPMATLALSGELMLMTALENQARQDSRVSVLDCRIDGEAMSLAEGLAKLREQVSRNPDDGRAWFQLGNLLSHINRPKATIHAFRQAVAAAPQVVDAKLRLAQRLASGQKYEEAFKILTDALGRSPDWRYFAHSPGFGQEFADLYNSLRRSLGKDHLPALHLASPTSPQKAGRNDPCPCGSGKKYKKCCGR